jgi:hypothetical protein
MKIEINVEHERIAKELIELISWMDYCGKVGHCSGFHVNFDGDGQAQIDVKTDNQEEYIKQRKMWSDNGYIKEKVFDGELRFSID